MGIFPVFRKNQKKKDIFSTFFLLFPKEIATFTADFA